MKIILAAGGSGGHIFPAVAVRDKLISSGVTDVFFIASKRKLDKNILREYGKNAYFLSINPMPLSRNPFKWIRFCFKFLTDMIKALIIIIRLDCDKIVGFGGYSSGAIVLAGRLLRRKVVLHEQNFSPGRANKLLAGFCDKIAVSFDGSGKFFSGFDDKIVHTGNPVREEVLHGKKQQAMKELELLDNTVTILVMGGSQGSSFLNNTVSRGIVRAKSSFPGRMQVIHLTGKADFEKVNSFYREAHFPARVFSFLDKIEQAYACADLAVSRSGAAAVFELAYYSVPMILVPYPHQKNNQRFNASYFEEHDAAIMAEERALTKENFSKRLLDLLRDEKELEKIAFNAKKLSYPDAAAELAAEVMEL